MKLFMYDFIDEFMNGLCMTYEYMTYALSVLSIWAKSPDINGKSRSIYGKME